MELVYLWVEDYKNIKKQGFNFSPRFRCDYNPSTNELTIDENDDYIENFFGDNINVTAIVGKNGSGKSSVLNALINCNEEHFPNDTQYLLVAYDGKNIRKYSNIESFENLDEQINLKVLIDRKNNDNDTIIVSGGRDIFKNYTPIDISKQTIVNLLAVELGKKTSSFALSSFMYLPNKITIKLKEKHQLIDEHINFITFNDREEVRTLFNTLFIEGINSSYHMLLFLEYIRSTSINNRDINILGNQDLLEGELADKKDNIRTVSNLSHVALDNHMISSLTEEEKDLYIRKGSYYNFLEFDLIDERERHFNDLSHGEQNIFGQLLNIYFYVINLSNLVFLLDEPEIALHPSWQKKYLNEVINLFKNTKSNVHLMLTSHSPFLLSDIPKQNIIFLDKDENGNCKVVDGLKEKKETFGANIHTLLSDSFFMEDGLMGEFAKSKIDEVIKLLNRERLNEKEIKYCEEIISIIGEPIIKNQLQKMLDNKRLAKIDLINQKIKDMSYELEVLKKYQSKLAKEELRDKGKKQYRQRFENDKN